MIRAIIGGAATAALLLLIPQAAAAAVRTPSGAWIVAPAEGGCRAELELAAASGAVVPATLFSDGQRVTLRFARPGLPASAFLPLRIDGARYANLMLRTGEGAGEMTLSEETQAALRKGSVLAVAWLGEAPLSAPLTGSDQGLSDLRTCGAQAASDLRARQAAEQSAREAAQAEAARRDLEAAQLAAARAQAEAAEAQRRDIETAAAERDRDRQRAAMQAEAEARAQADLRYRQARPYAPGGYDPYGRDPYEDEREPEPAPPWPYR